MTNYTVAEQEGVLFLSINGRIDSLTSPDIQHKLEDLVLGGNRLIVANLEQVSFLSSAGLRVFIIAQKALLKVGGEILFYGVSDNIMRVFEITGLDNMFKIIPTETELKAAILARGDATELEMVNVQGMAVKFRSIPDARAGTLCIVGSQEKLANADYTESDVVTVSQANMPFAAGLATVGERYQEYKDLFGESVMINNHFFFYPAVKRPAVDYMFYSGRGSGTDLQFLNGFGFDGEYRYLAAFESNDSLITLDKLIDWVMTLPLAQPVLGLVILAESKGLYGMNLKQIPLKEFKQAEDINIFNVDTVASWINFPVDPADHNHIVAATGLVCRDKKACPAAVRNLFSTESTAHIHAGIFSKGPVSKNIAQFTGELERVLTELDVSKVQHLLGQSQFSNGMLGIVEVKG